MKISYFYAKYHGYSAYDGDDCKLGHGATRYVSNHCCVDCTRINKSGFKLISRDRAYALNLKRYFTGDKCKHKHTAERYVLSGKCVRCSEITSSKRPRKGRTRVRKCWRYEDELLSSISQRMKDRNSE